MAATEIIHVPRGGEVSASDFLPLFQIDQAVARQQAMSQFIGQILRESTKDSPGDYGVIPGTNKQKVLLKPGAEKLCTFFGLSPHFEAEIIIEDWVGTPEHGGEPLFYYRYKCQLYRGDRFIAEAVGSCNSREKKYRWRTAERICPQCGVAAIITGKAEYGGGFVCFKKKNGCGAKFDEYDTTITSQEQGQVANPDIADLVNTIQKIAQKRALVASVLIGTNASDSFTQDLEEGEPAMAGQATTAPPSESERPVPPELREIFENLAKPGVLGAAATQMQNWLIEAGQREGDTVYQNIFGNFRAKYPKGTIMPIPGLKNCFLDLWEELVQFRAKDRSKLDPKPATTPRPSSKNFEIRQQFAPLKSDLKKLYDSDGKYKEILGNHGYLSSTEISTQAKADPVLKDLRTAYNDKMDEIEKAGGRGDLGITDEDLPENMRGTQA